MPQSAPDESAREFASRLRQQPENDLGSFAEAEILDGLPFIFSNRAEWTTFQGFIAGKLGLTPTDVFVVGSAMKGFSLAPDRFLRPFGDTSDIDLAIVDSTLFDAAWSYMLAWDYLTARKGRPAFETAWLAERRRETWRGWYDPTDWHRSQSVDLSFPVALRPLRNIGSTWFSNFQSLSRYPHSEVPRHRVEARLYRTRGHVRQYHAAGLRIVKRMNSGGPADAI